MNNEKASIINKYFNEYSSVFEVYNCDISQKVLTEINEFYRINIDDIVYAIEVRDISNLKTYDIPVFSSFENCTINLCGILDSINNKGIEMTELGKLLLQKNAKDMAYYKYGESHFKAAKILGLATVLKTKGKTKAYLTNIGYVYLTNPKIRNEILTRLLLKSKIVQVLIRNSFDKKYYASSSMIILSNKTINRRMSNVKRFISELLNSKEYDFKKIINNINFDYMETTDDVKKH